MAKSKLCDVVLEGGGVKGIGLVGALSVLSEEGHSFRRVAGTSAGAIVGALTAANMPIAEMRRLIQELDYRQFRDEGLLDRLGAAGKTASLVLEKGVYEGKFLQGWLAKELEKLGVKTFGDLRVTEKWAMKLPPDQRYKLVVLAADVTNGRLARLPWDYKLYGLDPDKQSVADAVRASMSIPFFYEPVWLGKNYLVDGGLLSNFPIDIFDTTPDLPTIGIKLSAKPEANLAMKSKINNTFDLAMAVLNTLTSAHDHMHLENPEVVKRTIFVDTLSIKATDFDITRDVQEKLYINGREAGRKFLGRP